MTSTSRKTDSFFDRVAHGRAVARWARLARLARTADLPDLARARRDAEALRREIEAFLRAAEDRLAVPVAEEARPRAPLGTDWTWRPALWMEAASPRALVPALDRQSLGPDLTIFHDCRASEIALRQIRNRSLHDIAPYGLRLDVFRFDGSFLSMALDLPETMLRGLRISHLVRLDLRVEREKPLEIFARLNVRHGPNTEQVVREVPFGAGPDTWVEFDLASTRLNERRVEKAWIDLIFEGPQMNEVVIRDLALSRHPRAEL